MLCFAHYRTTPYIRPPSHAVDTDGNIQSCHTSTAAQRLSSNTQQRKHLAYNYVHLLSQYNCQSIFLDVSNLVCTWQHRVSRLRCTLQPLQILCAAYSQNANQTPEHTIGYSAIGLAMLNTMLHRYQISCPQQLVRSTDWLMLVIIILKRCSWAKQLP